MKNKRLIITSLITIIFVSILFIETTYSIFTSSDIDEELNVYTTGNLDVTYTISNTDTTFVDSMPKSIEEANAVMPVRLTVNNMGTVPYMFDVILEDTTASDVIDYQYIMTKVGYLEPKALSECTNNVIKNDIIVSPNSSVDIDIRIWLSNNITNTEIDKSFYAKLSIDGKAIYDNGMQDNHLLSLRYMKGFWFDSDDPMGMNHDSFDYFRSDQYRTKIKNVSFVNYIDTTSAVESWDMSVEEDNSIIAWVTNNETEGYYDVYIGCTESIYADRLDFFFRDMKQLDKIDFSNLDTALTTSMYNMFHYTGYNSTVFTLNLGDKFNTSNVQNMSGMFVNAGYSSTVFTLDLGDKFDTSKVEGYMDYMFSSIGYSSTIFTLDLGDKFDTSKVFNMEKMFKSAGYSNSDFTLNFGSKFNTSNVTNMSNMFENTGYMNRNLVLDLSNFNFDKVTDTSNMFSGFSSTGTIYVKDVNSQNWILNQGFTNLSNSNVLIKE